MASKQFDLNDQTTVTIHKRKTSRHVRLSIASDGSVWVSIPLWAPFSMGVQFAKSREEWIIAQRQAPNFIIDGQSIGKAHHVHFQQSLRRQTIVSRVSGSTIMISYPEKYIATDPAVQKIAIQASIRALRSEAEGLLPQRLAQLADQFNFSYRGPAIKRLKSRWGSCDSKGNIVLNLFLMQLPWESIDYVLLHELTHTKVLQHGPRFWSAMETVCPDVSRIRKAMRNYQPVVNSLSQS